MHTYKPSTVTLAAHVPRELTSYILALHGYIGPLQYKWRLTTFNWPDHNQPCINFSLCHPKIFVPVLKVYTGCNSCNAAFLAQKYNYGTCKLHLCSTFEGRIQEMIRGGGTHCCFSANRSVQSAQSMGVWDMLSRENFEITPSEMDTMGIKQASTIAYRLMHFQGVVWFFWVGYYYKAKKRWTHTIQSDARAYFNDTCTSISGQRVPKKPFSWDSWKR